jgi:hypothetical protein
MNLGDDDLATRVRLILESIPEVYPGSDEIIPLNKEHGVLFQYANDGEFYLLTYIEDHDNSGNPSLVLRSMTSDNVPQQIVDDLAQKIGNKHYQVDSRGFHEWILFNEKSLPKRRHPNQLNGFYLYSAIWDMVPDKVEDGTILRFNEDQLKAAFNQQGILQSDYYITLGIAIQGNLLIIHSDGIGVTDNGLADYHSMLRRE